MKRKDKILSNSRVTLAENILLQDLAEESVLLNLESEKYFGLDLVGSKMLSCLQQTDSIEQAYQQLSEQFEVEPERLRQDLQEFIIRMVNYGLVKVTSA